MCGYNWLTVKSFYGKSIYEINRVIIDNVSTWFVPAIFNEFSKLKSILTCELSRFQMKNSERDFFNASCPRFVVS